MCKADTINIAAVYGYGGVLVVRSESIWTIELIADNTTAPSSSMQSCQTSCFPPAVLPKGGILADEMGLGKTVEMLALILAHKWPGEDRNGDQAVPDLSMKESRGSEEETPTGLEQEYGNSTAVHGVSDGSMPTATPHHEEYTEQRTEYTVEYTEKETEKEAEATIQAILEEAAVVCPIGTSLP